MPLMAALQSSQKPLAELNPYPKQRRDRATDLGSFWKVWDNVWNKLKILKPFYFEGTQFWPIYFFLWSQRSWAAHFLSPEDAPQRQLWPGIQRLCLTKDGAERGEAEWATHVRRFLVLTIPSENPRSWPRPMEFGMLKLLGSESEKTWALGSTSGWAKNRTNSEWTKNAVSVPTKQKKQNKWLIHISSD